MCVFLCALLFVFGLTYFYADIVTSMERATNNVDRRSERSYIHWSTQMDLALSNALLEQHNLGHKTPNGWKSVAFTAAIASMKETCNVEISKEKIMARLKTWNKYYQEITAMLDTSGFGWDWEKNMVKVDSEDVWANYVKVHLLIICSIYFLETYMI